MKYILAIFLITTFSISAQTLTNKTVLTVAQDGSGDYKTIQEAVNNVKDSLNKRTVITIKPGVYIEK